MKTKINFILIAILTAAIVTFAVAGNLTESMYLGSPQTQSPREKALKDKLKKTQQLIDFYKKKSIIAETASRRLIWLCDQNNIDTEIIGDESFWPKDQFVFPLKKGRRCFLGDRQGFLVINIISPTEFLAKIQTTAFRTRPDTKSTQVYKQPYIVIVKGISTADMICDKMLTFPCAFEITGPETYNTVLGSDNTVFVLKYLPMFNSKAILFETDPNHS